MQSPRSKRYYHGHSGNEGKKLPRATKVYSNKKTKSRSHRCELTKPNYGTIHPWSASSFPWGRESPGNFFKQRLQEKQKVWGALEDKLCYLSRSPLGGERSRTGQLGPALRAGSLPSLESMPGGLRTCCALCLEPLTPMPSSPMRFSFWPPTPHSETCQLMSHPRTRDLHLVAINHTVVILHYLYGFFKN